MHPPTLCAFTSSVRCKLRFRVDLWCLFRECSDSSGLSPLTTLESWTSISGHPRHIQKTHKKISLALKSTTRAATSCDCVHATVCTDPHCSSCLFPYEAEDAFRRVRRYARSPRHAGGLPALSWWPTNIWTSNAPEKRDLTSDSNTWKGSCADTLHLRPQRARRGHQPEPNMSELERTFRSQRAQRP